jgi:hypothetical protein
MSATVPAPTQSPNTAPADGRDPEPTTRGVAVLYNFEPAAPFVYMAHPRHYDVFPVEGAHEILPALRQFHLIPGVSGVRETEMVVDNVARVVADPTNAIAQLVRKGWVQVPDGWEVTAFGQKKTGYFHIYDGTRGRICLPRWVRLYNLGDACEMARDEDGFREFQRRIANELLPPLDTAVRKALHQKLLGLQRQVAGRDPSRGVAGAVAGELQAKLRVFDGGKPPRGKTAGGA